MAADTPQDIHRLFVEAFNAGDLPALLALYEPQACFVPQPGRTISGRDSIRAVLQQFLATHGTIGMETTFVVEAVDTALLGGKWHLHGTGPDGKPVEMEGKSIEVVKRQSDGSWRFVIDHPFGGE
jgi:uncharacterized protein (TIGR02246 family)